MAFFRRSQSSFEFLLIISFLMVVFVTVFSFANNKLSEAKEAAFEASMEDIAKGVISEVELATLMSDGYARTFVIPQIIDGGSYELVLIDGREVVITFLGKEYVAFLPINATGNLTFGENYIRKESGRIYLNG